jgi:hypothetical protein
MRPRPTLQPDAGGAGRSLLPIARWVAPFRDRVVLALELAGFRAAEIALPLKVIDVGGGVTLYEPVAAAGHARGRIMAGGLGTALAR